MNKLRRRVLSSPPIQPITKQVPEADRRPMHYLAASIMQYAVTVEMVHPIDQGNAVSHFAGALLRVPISDA
jgi:hypothetical protein